MISKRSSLLVQRCFRQLLIELVEGDLTAEGTPASRRGPATHYIAGALFELLTWWVDSRNTLAPRDLEAIFREWTAAALGVLRGRPELA